MINYPTIKKLNYSLSTALLFTVNVFFLPQSLTLWRSKEVINYYVKHCCFMIFVSKLGVKSLNEALICVT